MSAILQMGGADLSDITAQASDVRSGKKFLDKDGNLLTGTYDAIYTQAQYNAYGTQQYNAGRTQGQNDVKNNPGNYSLYTQAQYDARYNAGYNAAIASYSLSGARMTIRVQWPVPNYTTCLIVSASHSNGEYVQGASGVGSITCAGVSVSVYQKAPPNTSAGGYGVWIHITSPVYFDYENTRRVKSLDFSTNQIGYWGYTNVDLSYTLYFYNT